MDELRQFRRSHYNEKARWALDYKQWPHRRRTLLPGPHMPGVRALTGQSATPIFCLDGRWIAGSSAIIAALEARAPTPALYPADPGERAAALEIERRFDEDWGPRIRRAVFGQLLPTPTYLARIFSEGRPALERGFYALTAPLAPNSPAITISRTSPSPRLATLPRASRLAPRATLAPGAPSSPAVISGASGASGATLSAAMRPS